MGAIPNRFDPCTLRHPLYYFMAKPRLRPTLVQKIILIISTAILALGIIFTLAPAIIEPKTLFPKLPQPIKFYYYQASADKDQSCNSQFVLPLETDMVIDNPDTKIVDTINFLLLSQLSEENQKLGFTSEFPHPNFSLKSADLSTDGTLTLTFPIIPSFTSGGACRVSILRTQIEKTALQFPEVKKIVFSPEEIFQP